MMNKWVSVAISALSDFIITAGTGYTVAAVTVTGSILPTEAQIAVCVVGGLVQAARGVQKTLSPPPP